MEPIIEILMPIVECKPFEHHVFLDDEGNAWVPHAFVSAARCSHSGVGTSSSPAKTPSQSPFHATASDR